MRELEKSRERLRVALVRVEKAIEAKVSRLELENQALKTELKSRTTKPVTIARRKPVSNDIEEQEEDSLVNTNVFTEVDLSLKELKKLVG